MEVFNNQERPGYDEIVSYGPRWWTEFREMNANYKFAGWTLDLMAAFLEKLVCNLFPNLADEATVSLFEKILNIIPEDTDTLEDRRRTIAAYYSGNGKLSRSVIQSIVKAYSGCDSDVFWKGYVLQIRIYAQSEYRFSNMRINDIVSRRMPAHIGFLIRYMLCVFELSETFTEKVRYRMPFAWYGASLDGAHSFNGTIDLSALRPPYFRCITVVNVKNSEELTITKERHRAEFRGYAEEVKSIPKYRIRCIWWEGNLLNGESDLDGTAELNQPTPPDFNKSTYRTSLETKEDVVMSVYYPSKDVFVNGTYSLDGTINLNSGREEL